MRENVAVMMGRYRDIRGLPACDEGPGDMRSCVLLLGDDGPCAWGCQTRRDPGDAGHLRPGPGCPLFPGEVPNQ